MEMAEKEKKSTATNLQVERTLIENSKVAYYNVNGKLPTAKIAVEWAIKKALGSK